MEIDSDSDMFSSSGHLSGEAILWGAVIFRWYRDLLAEGDYADKSFLQQKAARQFFANRDYFENHICVWAGLSDGAISYVVKRFEIKAVTVVCGTAVDGAERFREQKPFRVSPSLPFMGKKGKK